MGYPEGPDLATEAEGSPADEARAVARCAAHREEAPCSRSMSCVTSMSVRAAASTRRVPGSRSSRPPRTGQAARTLRPVVSSWLVPKSLDPLVATDNVDVQRLFAVVGDDGADVAAFSAYPEEREVVYLPGTLFVVGPTESMHDIEVSFVEQTDRERAVWDALLPSPSTSCAAASTGCWRP